MQTTKHHIVIPATQKPLMRIRKHLFTRYQKTGRERKKGNPQTSSGGASPHSSLSAAAGAVVGAPAGGGVVGCEGGGIHGDD